MSRRCCSGQVSYRISGTLMLSRQHQISILVVADPARYNINGTSML
jgi:hypothetical protein